MPLVNGLRTFLLLVLRKAFGLFVHHSAESGHLEVERKFSITRAEAESIPKRLSELAFQSTGTILMKDIFLPCQEKGEMMRVRDEFSDGHEQTLLTFKKWVNTSDGGKERQECECQTSSLTRAMFLLAGKIIKGANLLSFSKKRSLYKGMFKGHEVVVSVDEVSGLGSFSGFYLEVELIVPLEENSTQAKASIFELVSLLFGDKRQDIRQSYLDMLELSLKERLAGN